MHAAIDGTPMTAITNENNPYGLGRTIKCGGGDTHLSAQFVDVLTRFAGDFSKSRRP
jgi:hypothetical protein